LDGGAEIYPPGIQAAIAALWSAREASPEVATGFGNRGRETARRICGGPANSSRSKAVLFFAVSNPHLASASGTGGRILLDLMRELNSGGSAPPQSWLDKQKIAADAFAYGLVRVVREVSDPRELSAYQADAFEYGRDG
jgi:hypothetical protein